MVPCDKCSLNNWYYDHPICIPPPKNIQGILISRDPTSEFKKSYEDYKQSPFKQSLGICHIGSAPPRWLCNRILSFMKYEPNSHEATILCNFLNFNCYWTHFHKCPTVKGDKKYHFSYEHGATCAGNWFDYEYTQHYLNGKILILLGQDLKKYYHENPESPLLKNNTVFFLPHPSGANMGNGWSWNPNKPEGDKDRMDVTDSIKQLISKIEEKSDKHYTMNTTG